MLDNRQSFDSTNLGFDYLVHRSFIQDRIRTCFLCLRNRLIQNDKVPRYGKR